jgi:protein N-terminal methyltransferase
VQWYTTAVDYWDRQEASVNGVLGGYGHLTSPDVRDSRAFLKKAWGASLSEAQAQGRPLAALDCGAGVGRVSEQLLLHHFQEVDLVEPSGGYRFRCFFDP